MKTVGEMTIRDFLNDDGFTPQNELEGMIVEARAMGYGSEWRVANLNRVDLNRLCNLAHTWLHTNTEGE